MCDAFRTALFKGVKPERLYFDNSNNYTSKEILQACCRLNIHLSHAPIRDGAAKGNGKLQVMESLYIQLIKIQYISIRLKFS